jgi:hypothetical protein
MIVSLILWFSKNKKKNIAYKSNKMNFRYLAFSGNYILMPSWYIKGNLSKVKKTDINEYCLKECINLKII